MAGSVSLLAGISTGLAAWATIAPTLGRPLGVFHAVATSVVTVGLTAPKMVATLRALTT
ncbi:hypothetical protein [Kutzneria sp. NPDC052558]|uniref:hypothetical protein n=1 Tax=Kutzneria sp. NPDC052558 TaxID=3364121 RepID=UPI0037C6503A